MTAAADDDGFNALAALAAAGVEGLDSQKMKEWQLRQEVYRMFEEEPMRVTLKVH